MDPPPSIDNLIQRVASLLPPLPSNPTPIASDPHHQDPEIQRTLLFKPISSRRIRKGHLIEGLSAVWNLSENNKIIDQGGNIYRVTLQSKFEADKIMREGPWIFENDLIVIERSRPRTLLKDYKFDTAEFWIQIHDVPFDLLKEETIACIAADIGEVLPIPRDECAKWNTYARIKVKININQPLKTKLLLPVDGNDQHTVEVRYEKLPRICLFCRIIGHDSEDCSIIHEVQEALGRTDLNQEDRNFLEKARNFKLSVSDIRAPPPPPSARSRFYKGKKVYTPEKSPTKNQQNHSNGHPPSRRILLLPGDEQINSSTIPLRHPDPTPQSIPTTLEPDLIKSNHVPNHTTCIDLPTCNHTPPTAPTCTQDRSTIPTQSEPLTPTHTHQPPKPQSREILQSSDINSKSNHQTQYIPSSNSSQSKEPFTLDILQPPKTHSLNSSHLPKTKPLESLQLPKSKPSDTHPKNYQNPPPIIQTESMPSLSSQTTTNHSKNPDIVSNPPAKTNTIQRKTPNSEDAAVVNHRLNPGIKNDEAKSPKSFKRVLRGPGPTINDTRSITWALNISEEMNNHNFKSPPDNSTGCTKKRKTEETPQSSASPRSKAVKLHDSNLTIDDINSQRAWAARQPRPQQ